MTLGTTQWHWGQPSDNGHNPVTLGIARWRWEPPSNGKNQVTLRITKWCWGQPSRTRAKQFRLTDWLWQNWHDNKISEEGNRRIVMCLGSMYKKATKSRHPRNLRWWWLYHHQWPRYPIVVVREVPHRPWCVVNEQYWCSENHRRQTDRQLSQLDCG